jgi:hypothetical protein
MESTKIKKVGLPKYDESDRNVSRGRGAKKNKG